jgi:hypothetical protein
VSLVLNGFANKTKHGYGYKDYSNGYYEEDIASDSLLDKIKGFLKLRG